MTKKALITIITALSLLAGTTLAQPAGGPARGGDSPRAQGSMVPEIDAWEVSVNQMSTPQKNRINQYVEQMQSRGGATRGVLNDIWRSSLAGGVSGMIDVVTSEIFNLAQYRKSQKQKWMRMIENECNYTDSITNFKGLKDFYSDTSDMGALDPSNINFDGISLRGMRDGEEVLYMSCHIDMDRLDHMFQHSKFYLVLDTLMFNAYKCHLPNLQANGIRLMHNQQTERDNTFSFDEREQLTVAIDITLSSSWINEAIMVQKNVELGSFSLKVDIDRNHPRFIYSRRQQEANRAAGHPNSMLIQIEGDCFVVPRSYMPISGGKRMWGTGEYSMKVKLRESCRFSNDKEKNQKMRQWYKDYKQLCKMQQKSQREGSYIQTVWKQYGNTLMKQMVKQGLTTGVTETGLMQQQGGMPGGAVMGGGGTMGGGGMSGATGGAMPTGMPTGGNGGGGPR